MSVIFISENFILNCCKKQFIIALKTLNSIEMLKTKADNSLLLFPQDKTIAKNRWHLFVFPCTYEYFSSAVLYVNTGYGLFFSLVRR